MESGTSLCSLPFDSSRAEGPLLALATMKLDQISTLDMETLTSISSVAQDDERDYDGNDKFDWKKSVTIPELAQLTCNG